MYEGLWPCMVGNLKVVGLSALVELPPWKWGDFASEACYKNLETHKCFRPWTTAKITRVN